MSQISPIDPNEDVPACAEVLVAAFETEPWNELWPTEQANARLREVLATPGGRGLLATDRDVVIGFIVGFVESFHPADRSSSRNSPRHRPTSTEASRRRSSRNSCSNWPTRASSTST